MADGGEDGDAGAGLCSSARLRRARGKRRPWSADTRRASSRGPGLAPRGEGRGSTRSLGMDFPRLAGRRVGGSGGVCLSCSCRVCRGAALRAPPGTPGGSGMPSPSSTSTVHCLALPVALAARPARRRPEDVNCSAVPSGLRPRSRLARVRAA
ncbi:uncharacterized protein LOC134529441 [Bacillus rossius redtenbacheri]|uniref:uncharacterized protein LOC134529441 n=1 Tax=Bacillus rossius redtenbacheri TaxID=93214 RepID=UPI002FDDE2E2